MNDSTKASAAGLRPVTEPALTESDRKLYLACVLKCMEELEDGRHERDRNYLQQVIMRRTNAIADSYPAGYLSSYPRVLQAYRDTRWHHATGG